jgi:hypothetical protein
MFVAHPTETFGASKYHSMFHELEVWIVVVCADVTPYW